MKCTSLENDTYELVLEIKVIYRTSILFFYRSLY